MADGQVGLIDSGQRDPDFSTKSRNVAVPSHRCKIATDGLSDNSALEPVVIILLSCTQSRQLR